MLYCVPNIILFIVAYQSYCLIGYNFRIFSVFYFINILIPKFCFNFYNAFSFKIYFTKTNPLCTDPQLFWKRKCFFVTVTIVVNSTHSTISSFFSSVYFSTHFDEDINEIIDCSHVDFSVPMINIWVWALWYEAQWLLMETKKI